MTKTELIQQLWNQYECEHDHMAASGREFAEWVVANDLIPLPVIDPIDVLSGQVSRALRQEYAVDPKGRRYRRNHAVRVTKNGVQTTMWGIAGFAPFEHVEMALTQRREQIVGDVCQLKTDQDVINDMYNGNPPIELIFDFTEDIAEREVFYNGYSDDDDPDDF